MSNKQSTTIVPIEETRLIIQLTVVLHIGLWQPISRAYTYILIHIYVYCIHREKAYLKKKRKKNRKQDKKKKLFTLTYII